MIRLYLIFLLLGCGFNFHLSAQQFDDEKQQRKHANKLFDKHQYVEALKHYQHLLSLNQKDADLHFKYGACLIYHKNQGEKAKNHLLLAQKYKCEDGRLYFYLGKIYHLQYYFNKALKYYDLFKKNVPEKEYKEYEVSRHINNCKSGKLLLNRYSEIIVLDKKKAPDNQFFRYYDLKDIGGKIIVAKEFSSNLDKKLGHSPVIYFSANSKRIFYSSYGKEQTNGRDLYMLDKNTDGSWGEPIRLPEKINSQYDEDYAYMHPNGKTFYFSSKGHNSMGGYDIFKCSYDSATNTFGKVENIDFKINTPDDDLFYILDKKEENAYFSSRRASKLGQTDVYSIKVKTVPPKEVLLVGRLDNTFDEDVKILIKNSEGVVIKEINVNAGENNYQTDLQSGQDYQIEILNKNKESLAKTDFSIEASNRFETYEQSFNTNDEREIITEKKSSNFIDENALANYFREASKVNINIDQYKDELSQDKNALTLSSNEKQLFQDNQSKINQKLKEYSKVNGIEKNVGVTNEVTKDFETFYTEEIKQLEQKASEQSELLSKTKLDSKEKEILEKNNDIFQELNTKSKDEFIAQKIQEYKEESNKKYEEKEKGIREEIILYEEEVKNLNWQKNKAKKSDTKKVYQRQIDEIEELKKEQEQQLADIEKQRNNLPLNIGELKKNYLSNEIAASDNNSQEKIDQKIKSILEKPSVEELSQVQQTEWNKTQKKQSEIYFSEETNQQLTNLINQGKNIQKHLNEEKNITNEAVKKGLEKLQIQNQNKINEIIASQQQNEIEKIKQILDDEEYWKLNINPENKQKLIDLKRESLSINREFQSTKTEIDTSNTEELLVQKQKIEALLLKQDKILSQIQINNSIPTEDLTQNTNDIFLHQKQILGNTPEYLRSEDLTKKLLTNSIPAGEREVVTAQLNEIEEKLLSEQNTILKDEVSYLFEEIKNLSDEEDNEIIQNKIKSITNISNTIEGNTNDEKIEKLETNNSEFLKLRNELQIKLSNKKVFSDSNEIKEGIQEAYNLIEESQNMDDKLEQLSQINRANSMINVLSSTLKDIKSEELAQNDSQSTNNLAEGTNNIDNTSVSENNGANSDSSNENNSNSNGNENQNNSENQNRIENPLTETTTTSGSDTTGLTEGTNSINNTSVSENNATNLESSNENNSNSNGNENQNNSENQNRIENQLTKNSTTSGSDTTGLTEGTNSINNTSVSENNGANSDSSNETSSNSNGNENQNNSENQNRIENPLTETTTTSGSDTTGLTEGTNNIDNTSSTENSGTSSESANENNSNSNGNENQSNSDNPNENRIENQLTETSTTSGSDTTGLTEGTNSINNTSVSENNGANSDSSNENNSNSNGNENQNNSENQNENRTENQLTESNNNTESPNRINNLVSDDRLSYKNTLSLENGSAFIDNEFEDLVNIPKLNTVKADVIPLNQMSTKYIVSGAPLLISPIKKVEGLVYKVQVGAFYKQLPEGTFDGLHPVEYEKSPNSRFYKYSVGYYNRYKIANEAKNEVRKKGYRDAFVVAFYDGKRIPLYKARRLEQSLIKEQEKSEPVLVLNTNETNKPLVKNNNEISENNSTDNRENNSNENIQIVSANEDSTLSPVNSQIEVNGISSQNPEKPQENKNQIIQYNDELQGVDISKIDALFFTVQIGVYVRPTDLVTKFNMTEVNVLKLSNGWLRYSSGRFNSIEEANERKNQARTNGISDAFITAYYKGERIRISKARELINQFGNSILINR